jgi:hypothetical protein
MENHRFMYQRLPQLQNGRVVVQPEVLLKSKIVHGRRQVLVHWKDALAAESYWVDLEEFREKFPEFQLKDELLPREGEMSYGATPLPGTSTRRPKASRLRIS